MHIKAPILSAPRVIAPVVILAAVMLSACSSPAVVADADPTLSVGDLVGQGYSAEVATCVTGIAADQPDSGSIDGLIDSCERAERMLNEPEPQPVELAFAGPTSYGDDALLDGLWDRCELGEGSACDELWERAPLDSDYERFGVTCGERENVLNCADLQLETDSDTELDSDDEDLN